MRLLVTLEASAMFKLYRDCYSWLKTLAQFLWPVEPSEQDLQWTDVRFIVQMPLCGRRKRRWEKRGESRWDAETCHLSQMSLSSEWTRSVVSNSPREMTSLIRDRLSRTAQRFHAFWLYYCEKVRWWIWIWNQPLEGLNGVWIRGSVVCLLTDKQDLPPSVTSHLVPLIPGATGTLDPSARKYK